MNRLNGVTALAADLLSIGGSLKFNGHAVRPELQITHRAAKLKSGIGAPVRGSARRAEPNTLKQELRRERIETGLSPRQQRKAMKQLRAELKRSPPNP